MNNWLLVVLYCLAVYRVTRLLTTDQVPVTMIPREKMLMWLYPDYADADTRSRYDVAGKTYRARWGEYGRTIAYLIVCPWCVSIWVAAVTLPLLSEFTPLLDGWHWVMIVMLGLASSSVTGVLSQHEPE